MILCKLIKTKDGYRWDDLNRPDAHMAKTIEIETWKGVYQLPKYPNVEKDDYIHYTPFYPIWLLERNGKVFHPILKRWIRYQYRISEQNIHDDIMQWIELQPLRPDYEQAAKDRVDVEQTFSEFTCV